MEREALKLALEALKEILTNDGGEGSKCYSAIRLYDARILGGEAIKALEEALANHCEDNLDMVKQEQGEPVAWALEWTFDGEEKGIRLYDDETHCRLDAENGGGVCRSLVYSDTTPQQRTWVGLTDEEKADLVHELFAPCNKEANDVLYRLTTYYANNALYLLTAHYNKLKDKNT
jgi:hypothetical protein